MFSKELEYNILLVGWVIPFLLGLILLLIKTSRGAAYSSYNVGKNTCAAAILLFGGEILFQWILRDRAIVNAILSVTVYLFVFCAATLLFVSGYCVMMSPDSMSRRHRVMAISTLVIYSILLIASYFAPTWTWQLRGVMLCCALLFFITCFGLYRCVKIYRKVIDNLRQYYSDMVDNMVRWMPGVGGGVLAFLLSAPFICWMPQWVGTYQVMLGIIMFFYTFICVINFSARYSSLAATFDVGDSDANSGSDEVVGDTTRRSNDERLASRSAMSASLQEVLRDKERRWIERGGYRLTGITIEQAAQAMGTNRSYLSRYLNEVCHVSFYSWVAQMRVDEAKYLLLEDRNAPIEQIADVLGFSSSSSFCSAFKKIEGISPNRWRNLH